MGQMVPYLAQCVLHTLCTTSIKTQNTEYHHCLCCNFSKTSVWYSVKFETIQKLMCFSVWGCRSWPWCELCCSICDRSVCGMCRRLRQDGVPSLHQCHRPLQHTWRLSVHHQHYCEAQPSNCLTSLTFLAHFYLLWCLL